jgi:hypothetical protein
VRMSLAQTGRWLVGRREVPGGAAQGRAEGVHTRGAGPLDDDERDAGGAVAPSRAGGAPLRDAAALGPAVGAARLSRGGVAGAGSITARDGNGTSGWSLPKAT